MKNHTTSTGRMCRQHADIQPLGPERWSDLTRLFGERGAYSGCWCMWWRVARSEFDRLGNEGRKKALHKIVKAGTITGIIAYHGGEPVGWCSVAPRETYSALERSRTLARIDDQPVWSIVCFFVAKPYRGRGVSEALIEAAIGYAEAHGAEIVEAYPVDRRARKLDAVSVYMGVASMFRKAGFKDVARPSGTRRIIRYYIR